TSAAITNDEIVDADINSAAAISASKLQASVMVEGEDVSLLNNDAGYLTTVTSAAITNDEIVDADINSAAAIAGTKISPSFGTQNIVTSGTLSTGAATVTGLTVTALADATSRTYDETAAGTSLTISSTGVFGNSDIRLKENIKPLDSPLDKILASEGLSYNYKADADTEIHFGVIAQEIEKLFPHMVKEDSRGYKSVNYTELIPVLIEAIKEQQKLIEKLMADLSDEKTTKEEMKAALDKQMKLSEMQMKLMAQLQMENSSMKSDIDLIKEQMGIKSATKTNE
ncbi:tail fiber domain-containing protein, partial [uncultured Imperialibacter sp.]|uniref:tail fiber domain-containing protein n=1 Tax=uncultured Imperialibacter sp. TaxID=1672639 RepID=UPI0030DB2E73